MIKYSIQIFLIFSPVVASEIEDITTTPLVEKFLKEKISPTFKDVNLSLRDGFEGTEPRPTKIFKADLDGNGLTDLIFAGRLCFAILDLGKSKYKYIYLFSDDSGILPVEEEILGVEKIDNIWGIRISQTNPHTLRSSQFHLVYKFNSFVEFNYANNTRKLTKVVLINDGCLGRCPIFRFELEQTGAGSLIAKKHNKRNGSFRTKAGQKYFREIAEIIDYINPDYLLDSYAVTHTCDATATLEIHFSGGYKRIIHDYGKTGTYGLRTLYEKIYEINNLPIWQ